MRKLLGRIRTLVRRLRCSQFRAAFENYLLPEIIFIHQLAVRATLSATFNLSHGELLAAVLLCLCWRNVLASSSGNLADSSSLAYNGSVSQQQAGCRCWRPFWCRRCLGRSMRGNRPI
jgi:hypothetical protein